jgi:hypothetical protein
MTIQTIPEYLEEERQKAADTQLRTEEEAERIQPLQHGHHRASKRASKSSRLELAAPAKSTTKKKQKEKTAAAGRTKPRAGVKKATKTRKKK